MRLFYLLLTFYFITMLGSALSGIASFLSIENHFHSILYLGLALSARTFAAFCMSYHTNKLVHYLGIYRSLILSQLFGFIALLILFAGFHFNNFTLTLLGIMVTCLPSTLVSILLSITFRLELEDPKEFRKYSGNRELVSGIAGILAAVLAPLLLFKSTLNSVLIIDAFTYIVSIIFLIGANIPIKNQVKQPDNPPILIHKLLLKSPTLIFLLQTTASLLLAGLIPLLASSTHIYLTSSLPTLLRQWLWSTDQLAILIASSCYVLFLSAIKKPWVSTLLVLNGIFLIIPLFLTTGYSIITVAILIGILIQISFQKFRDDFILSAGDNSALVQAHSSLAFAQRNFIYFLSPLLLGVLFSCSISVFVYAIVGLQLVLYFTLRYIKILSRSNVVAISL